MLSSDLKIEPKRRAALILLTDDQEWSGRAFESVLSENYSVIRCRSAGETLEHLQTISPDALLIQSELPDRSGIDLCRTLKTFTHIGATTPVFMVCSTPMRRAERLEALRSGAWDLLSLPLDAEEFVLKLGSLVRAKLEADRARDHSLLDLASGLYSVQGLIRKVRELTSDALRRQAPVACVVIGPEGEWVDRLKEVPSNQTPMADWLVRLMNTVGRTLDAIGRLSQTEFVVLAPHTTSEGAVLLANRLHRAAEAISKEDGGNDFKVRVGCYAIDRFDDATLEPVQILVRATMALRRAQRDASSPPVCFFGQQFYAS